MVRTSTRTRSIQDDESWLLATARAHWLRIVGIALVGAVLGALIGFLRAPVYTAEARYAVGSGEMNSSNIPGFPTASIAMAQNYARWVTTQGVSGFETPEGTLEVSASPLPESNVLRVEATSGDPEVAMAAADAAGRALMAAVNDVASGNDPEAILTEIETHQPEVDRALLTSDFARQAHITAIAQQASPEHVQHTLDLYVQANAAYTVLDAEQDARISRYNRLKVNQSTEASLTEVTEGAFVSGDTRSGTIQRYALVGFGIGGLLGAAALGLRERRGRHSASDVAGEAEPDSP